MNAKVIVEYILLAIKTIIVFTRQAIKLAELMVVDIQTINIDEFTKNSNNNNNNITSYFTGEGV